ncbi:Crp/Fnr family transcriptional regulator [Zhouia sp. PK063]|uniref:Crp/Fnr family transcriptional regulator n=1 Tax=Zhouia sp. PK063 TaxID=3373602 RepID=UPI00378DAFBC
MLRTNHHFYTYVQELHEKQKGDDICVKSFHTKDLLLQQGTTVSRIWLLTEGIVKCYVYEENDKTYILEFLSQGEIVGELEAIQHIPCLCTIEALTPVTAYGISMRYFQALMQHDFRFNHLLLTTFAQRIIHTSSRAAFQQSFTLSHSLGKLLHLIEEEDLQLSKEDMASYLGITVRSLNRALKSFPKATF